MPRDKYGREKSRSRKSNARSYKPDAHAMRREELLREARREGNEAVIKLLEHDEQCGARNRITDLGAYERAVKRGLLPQRDPVTGQPGIDPRDAIHVHGGCWARSTLRQWMDEHLAQGGDLIWPDTGVSMTREDLQLLGWTEEPRDVQTGQRRLGGGFGVGLGALGLGLGLGALGAAATGGYGGPYYNPYYNPYGYPPYGPPLLLPRRPLYPGPFVVNRPWGRREWSPSRGGGNRDREWRGSFGGDRHVNMGARPELYIGDEGVDPGYYGREGGYDIGSQFNAYGSGELTGARGRTNDGVDNRRGNRGGGDDRRDGVRQKDSGVRRGRRGGDDDRKDMRLGNRGGGDDRRDGVRQRNTGAHCSWLTSDVKRKVGAGVEDPATAEREEIANWRRVVTQMTDSEQASLREVIRMRMEECGPAGLVSDPNEQALLITHGLLPYIDPVTEIRGIIPDHAVMLNGRCASSNGLILWLEQRANDRTPPALFDGTPVTRAIVQDLNLDPNDYVFFTRAGDSVRREFNRDRLLRQRRERYRQEQVNRLGLISASGLPLAQFRTVLADRVGLPTRDFDDEANRSYSDPDADYEESVAFDLERLPVLSRLVNGYYNNTSVVREFRPEFLRKLDHLMHWSNGGRNYYVTLKDADGVARLIREGDAEALNHIVDNRVWFRDAEREIDEIDARLTPERRRAAEREIEDALIAFRNQPGRTRAQFMFVAGLAGLILPSLALSINSLVNNTQFLIREPGEAPATLAELMAPLQPR